MHVTERARGICEREREIECCDDDEEEMVLTLRRFIRTFINKVFNFFGIGISLYIIANVYTWVSNDAVIKNTVKCKFCRKRISEKVCFVSIYHYLERRGGGGVLIVSVFALQAQRCVNCTSWVDGREEQVN